MAIVGSRAQVFHGNAKRTSGGLTKDDLMQTKDGRIISRRKHEMGKIAFKANGLKAKTKEELAEMRPKKNKTESK